MHSLLCGLTEENDNIRDASCKLQHLHVPQNLKDQVKFQKSQVQHQTLEKKHS